MNHLHVMIGEIKLGASGDLLMASLGSCIGIGILWKKKMSYGLAHCLLPHTVDKTIHPAGRYVEEAIPALLEMMEITQPNIKELDIIIVGGGNMTQTISSETKLIGEMNTVAARETCRKLHLPIAFEDTLGNFGRKVQINCDASVLSEHL